MLSSYVMSLHLIGGSNHPSRSSDKAQTFRMRDLFTGSFNSTLQTRTTTSSTTIKKSIVTDIAIMEERESGGGHDRVNVGRVGNVAKVLLLLLNMTFMVAGCLIIYFSHRVKMSGWLDVFEGSNFTWIATSTFIFTLTLGAVVVVISAFGCFGALLQQKLLLLIYACVLLLTLVLFIVVAVGANMANSMADNWSNSNYPVTSNEALLGAHFNQIYCHAQIPYYCQDATVNTVMSMFNISAAGFFADTTTNFNNICSTVTLPAISSACTVCSLIAQYSQYSMILDWSEASCPRTSVNQIWCGGFLLNATAAEEMSTSAPFMGCRGVFYDLVERWTNVVLVNAIIFIIASGIVLAMTGVLWRNMRVPQQQKETIPISSAPIYHNGDHNIGFSQRSEATANSNNFSMFSSAPRNRNAAHRRYDSPY